MPASEVEQYLARFDGDVRVRLDWLRATVNKLAPDAVENLSYGLVGYKLQGKPLLYFGAFPNHIGLYATPNGHAKFAKEFSAYKQGKGSVQFPHSSPLPKDLIIRVIEYRQATVS